MERKVLTYNDNGIQKDFIPYVDDLAIQIGGTNLRDYLAQIEENIQNAILFLGAFETEEILLNKYPNGTELKEGSYAIVTDVDALYIYDTETLRWLKTASATLGILQINGLNGINGSLTITGGDIESTVSNADQPTQTITSHLNELYGKTKELSTKDKGIMAYSYSNMATEVGDRVVYHATVGMEFKNSLFLATKLLHYSANNTDHHTKLTNISIDYNDGTSKQYTLRTADGVAFTYRMSIDYFGYDYSSPYVVLYLSGENAYILTINHKNNWYKVWGYSLTTDSWIDNEEGEGYKQILEINPRAVSPNVLSVYKTVNGEKTKAVVDYSIVGNTITILSDEKFEGGVVISYYYQ